MHMYFIYYSIDFFDIIRFKGDVESMKKKVLSLTLTAALLMCSFAGGTSAKAAPMNTKEDIIKKLQEFSKDSIRITEDKTNGVQVFLSGKLYAGRLGSIDEAFNFLDQNKELFSLTNVKDNLKVVKVNKDELGYTHIRLEQMLNGVAVEDGELTVHFDNKNFLINVTTNLNENLLKSNFKATENINENGAKTIVQDKFKGIDAKISFVKKVVILDNDAPHTTYKFNVYYQQPEIQNYDVYVDVTSGNIVKQVSKIMMDGPVTGSGTAVNGTQRSLNLYQAGNVYQTKDTTKPMTGQILTYTANYTETQPGSLYTSSSTTISDPAVVSAHSYAEVVYDFYKLFFNRNSIDNNGMSIKSTVHYGSNYNNAFWDGYQMTYGDGDGSQFKCLAGDLDVVGHEMTHGVTSNTANLTYRNQSGALNESMSDVFGVLIQTWDKYNVRNNGAWQFNSADWVVGDEITTPNTPGDALRSLADPTLYNQPAHMNNLYTGTQDNGGVHINSGIPNKAAYLIAQNIGCEKLAKIYYRALTTYFNASTNFQGARDGFVQAATDLYGASSQEVQAITTAYSTVGVGSSTPNPDTYEPNNTTAQAYAITSNTTYSSYISSASDVDYYKITPSRTGTVTISLTNLPYDYDVYLYNSAGTQVAKSTKSSTSNESISYNASAGTYYIKVIGYNGVYSTSTAYNLKAVFQ